MDKWINKILFIAISFSFFTSAVEMDIGESHHTFFDEYDTYLKTEQVSFDYSDASVQDHNSFTLVSPFIINQLIPGIEPSSSRHQCTVYLNHFPPKLFLYYSVWLI